MGRTAVVQFPEGARIFPLRHRIQTAYSPHPASYTPGTGGAIFGSKAIGA